jgi:hypothetical protein
VNQASRRGVVGGRRRNSDRRARSNLKEKRIMSKNRLIGVALAGVLSTGLAQAGGDVQWSVTIGVPGVVFATAPVYAPVFVAPAPMIVRAVPAYEPIAPVHYVPYSRPVHGWAYRDSDRDGIPNRYDRVYNPRWDRDGDGIPNRHDRWDNRRESRYDDRHDHRRDDRRDRGNERKQRHDGH